MIIFVGKHILSFHRQRYFSMKVDSKQLAKLRKNTGYGLLVCKEALLENDNDVGLAQTWLDEQAIKKGWQKAEKLVGRKIGEGLIGVIVEGNHAAMVEVLQFIMVMVFIFLSLSPCFFIFSGML